eukprot:s1267_g30.t1
MLLWRLGWKCGVGIKGTHSLGRVYTFLVGAGCRPVPAGAGRCRPVPGRTIGKVYRSATAGGRPVPVAGRCRPVPAGCGPRPAPAGSEVMCLGKVPLGRCRWGQPSPVAGRCRLPAGAGCRPVPVAGRRRFAGRCRLPAGAGRCRAVGHREGVPLGRCWWPAGAGCRPALFAVAVAGCRPLPDAGR